MVSFYVRLQPGILLQTGSTEQDFLRDDINAGHDENSEIGSFRAEGINKTHHLPLDFHSIRGIIELCLCSICTYAKASLAAELLTALMPGLAFIVSCR